MLNLASPAIAMQEKVKIEEPASIKLYSKYNPFRYLLPLFPTPALKVTYVFRRASLIRNLARPRRHPTQVNRHVSHHAAGNHDVGSVVGCVLRDDFGDVHLGDVRPRLTRPADPLDSSLSLTTPCIEDTG